MTESVPLNVNKEGGISLNSKIPFFESNGNVLKTNVKSKDKDNDSPSF